MEYYLYIKIFHYLAFISWMAMLFYLPRLFVYHAENIQNVGFVEVVKIQEEKLYKYIGNPAMVSTLLSGIAMMAINPAIFSGGWLHAKIVLIILLLGYHFSLKHYMIEFKNSRCQKSGKFFRWYNEVPTIVMIFIITLIVLKPF